LRKKFWILQEKSENSRPKKEFFLRSLSQRLQAKILKVFRLLNRKIQNSLESPAPSKNTLKILFPKPNLHASLKAGRFWEM